MWITFGLFALFCIISAIVFFKGMRNPDLLNKNLKEGTKPWTKKSAKNIFVTFTCLTVLFCTLTIINLINSMNAAPAKADLATSTTKIEQNKPVVKKVEAANAKKEKSNTHVENTQQKTLKSFVSQIQNDQLPVSNALTNLGVAIGLFNGSDTSNISTAVSVLKNRSETAINDFSIMSPPSGFSDDIEVLLTGAVSNYMLASYAEADAADSFSHYIDSQDPNDSQKFKDKIADAKANISQANSYLSQAEQKIGIKQ